MQNYMIHELVENEGKSNVWGYTHYPDIAIFCTIMNYLPRCECDNRIIIKCRWICRIKRANAQFVQFDLWSSALVYAMIITNISYTVSAKAKSKWLGMTMTLKEYLFVLLLFQKYRKKRDESKYRPTFISYFFLVFFSSMCLFVRANKRCCLRKESGR